MKQIKFSASNWARRSRPKGSWQAPTLTSYILICRLCSISLHGGQNGQERKSLAADADIAEQPSALVKIDYGSSYPLQGRHCVATEAGAGGTCLTATSLELSTLAPEKANWETFVLINRPVEKNLT